ncbi:MAG: hypothetical protein IJC15_08335, partial [Clostridia bacterium]|nr:hypothetical protein [Clostridia bacterium]
MKKALSILLAVCMLAVMCIVPVSAEAGPVQTLEDVKASGADYLQLTHKNVKTYELEASPYPGDLTESEYKVGSKVYSHDDVCFTNVTKSGEDYETQTPGSIIWDIEANKYQIFQCEFGKGSWNHSSGAPVKITVIAVY